MPGERPRRRYTTHDGPWEPWDVVNITPDCSAGTASRTPGENTDAEELQPSRAHARDEDQRRIAFLIL